MYTVTVEHKFEAAHRLTGKEAGECTNIHGHSYKVKLHFSSEQLDDDRMVMNFKNIKRFTSWIEEKFDHALILSIKDPVLLQMKPILKTNSLKYVTLGADPTAEQMTQCIANELKTRRGCFPSTVYLDAVEVFETATTCACYYVTPEFWNGSN